jgi:hypothetical protein
MGIKGASGVYVDRLGVICTAWAPRELTRCRTQLLHDRFMLFQRFFGG